ncbi:hypothetical protein AURDEDRAFT_176045 [Auricularia subglabra TFB-10046 SS5]|uniref:Uncharacterized protein n=1 Tax=Auricularia subglabra (strain TFB-10046 / SS5) TaxID=717982 RepID=J0D793_AURST|nr:hypothetical protein AURDEDRAFT_176045 [Auricularia subglabra TFB-10046 SS5]
MLSLADRFYKGLPWRIKEVMGTQIAGRPTDLTALRAWALAIDANQWNSGLIKKCDNSHSKSQPSSTTNHNNKNSSNSSNNTSSKKNTSAASSRTTNTTTKSSSSAPRSSAPDLTGKLASTGKLTNEERARRLKENLCLYYRDGAYGMMSPFGPTVGDASYPSGGAEIPRRQWSITFTA